MLHAAQFGESKTEPPGALNYTFATGDARLIVNLAPRDPVSFIGRYVAITMT